MKILFKNLLTWITFLNPWECKFLILTISFSLTGFTAQWQEDSLLSPFSEAGNSPYQIKAAFHPLRFHSPIDIEEVSPQLFLVLTRAGKVWRLKQSQASWQKELILDISNEVGPNPKQETGALSLALSPESSLVLFLSYTMRSGKKLVHRLSKFTLSPNTRNPPEETILIERLLSSPIHIGGGIGFDTDGFLLFSIGDNGTPQNAQPPIKDFAGTILRLDVNCSESDPSYRPVHDQKSLRKGGYCIPDTNPFKSHKSLSEIWAFGFRNPWKFAFFGKKTLVFDVGETDSEEINFAEKGRNHQWPVYEGRTLKRPMLSNARRPQTRDRIASDANPHLEPAESGLAPRFSFSNREVSSIIGGAVYQGERFPELHQHIIFADGEQGELKSVPISGKESDAKELAKISGPAYISAVQVTSDGQILMNSVTIPRVSGSPLVPIYRLEYNPKQTSWRFPKNLSELKINDLVLGNHKPANAISYNVKVPAWNPRLKVQRWAVLPKDKAGGFIRFEEGELGRTAPTGTLFIKQLSDQNSKPIETQILYKTLANQGVLASYRWENANTATLVQSPISSPENQHSFLSSSQCSTCHSPQAGFVLGFHSEQWVVPPKNVPKALALRFLAENSATQDSVVHSKTESLSKMFLYRCGGCHRNSLTAFQINPQNGNWLPELVGVAANLAVGENSQLVVPGEPMKSILFLRLRGDSANLGMPPTQPYGAEEDLIQKTRDWIATLSEHSPRS